MSAAPDSDFPIQVLDHEHGCPEGFVCISSPSAVATGLFIRDSDRVFADIKGCPYVKVDADPMYTALAKYLNSGTPLPTK